MAIVLTNALLADLDPPKVEAGDLRVANNRIAARGKVRRDPTDEIFDCGGAVVLPGLVNGHTHLYSALAVGMPPPPRVPRKFLEILQLVWWRLDRALDAESIEMSARIGALDAIRSGTTTLIDHHASPNCIGGSLDLIERALSQAGVRGVLCYETTDRHGDAGRQQGLEENRRYIEKCAAAKNSRFAAMAGAHASFTMDDISLQMLEGCADEFDVGVHIHVAEDSCDEDITRQKYRSSLIDRLSKHGLLRPQTIFAHGIHLSDAAIAAVNEAGVTLAHNPRSNMNNAVGYAPLGKFTCPVMLGTDGIGADMFSEAKAAWFKSRDGNGGLSPADVVKMLANSARRASESLGVTLGKLDVGAAADIVVTDFVPCTPLTAENLPGQFVFGLDSRHVCDVMCNGRWTMRDHKILAVDEHAVRQESSEIARNLWQRMQSIGAD